MIEKISYSAYKAFSKCQHLFFLKHVKGIRLFKGTVHTALGNALHEALEIGMKRSGTIESAFVDFDRRLKEEIDKSSILVPDMGELTKKGKDMLIRFWHQHAPNIFGLVVETEKGFGIPMSGFRITGYIDLIVKTKGEGLGVVDYKSGKNKSEDVDDSMQLSIYAAAVEHTYGKLPDWLCLHYLLDDVREFTKRSAAQKAEALDTIAKFHKRVSSMAEEDFLPCKKHCRLCDLKSECTHFSKMSSSQIGEIAGVVE